MTTINRRRFLSALSGPLALAAAPIRLLATRADSTNGGCWLNVCVPIVIEDPANKLHTEIILTSDNFPGLLGYGDKENISDYELFLYDAGGKQINIDGKRAPRLIVPAMHTTTIRLTELLRGRDSFYGGMNIRVWARGKEPTHASDLFSTAYVRWNQADSFDTLHAHPDPPQFHARDKFYSSMPFPNLEEFACTLSIFNPYEVPSAGKLVVHAPDGQKRIEQAYRLPPHGSSLFDVNSGKFTTDIRTMSNRRVSLKKEIVKGGSITIENDPATVKNFAYMTIRGKTDNSFAAEHTIHQGNYEVKRGGSPFGTGGAFNPRGWVWSSFIFNNRTIAGLKLSSRVYVSSARPLEDEMWMLGYLVDKDGSIQWTTTSDDELELWLPSGFRRQGAIRLSPFQSCELDFEKLSLDSGFAGGIGFATSPPTSHVLMKIETRVLNWGSSAFSHFRPGAKGARAVQPIKQRERIASDYVVTGASVRRAPSEPEADSLIAILNIEKDKVGRPLIEVFDPSGFVTSKRLETIPGWACRYHVLSELFPELRVRGSGPLTLRLIDNDAVVIMSAMHIDYKRRDIAIDHGSDRFSTFIDHGCQ